MSSQTTQVKIDNLCQCSTVTNNRCKNRATINGKCTYHNNRLNNITNSGICKKLIFEECEGYEYRKIKQDEIVNLNDEYTYILTKCNDIVGTTTINNKHYCGKHNKEYKYEKPDECVICSETIEYNKEVPLGCGHWFHLNCLKQCHKMQCPICRKFYNLKEIQLIYDLVTVAFTESNNAQNNEITPLLIPRKILINEIYGLNYIELLYFEIVTLYKTLNLRYNAKKINKVLLNLFKDEEYLKMSLTVYNMFDKIIENGKVKAYLIKDGINFYEDNEYTLNYDRFEEIIENLYYSV